MANFKNSSGKKIFYIGLGVFIIHELLRIVYVRDWNDNIYINDKLWILIMNIIFNVLETVFFLIPLKVLFMKLIPPSIAGLIIALQVTLRSFFDGILSTLINRSLNKNFFKITKDNINE